MVHRVSHEGLQDHWYIRYAGGSLRRLRKAEERERTIMHGTCELCLRESGDISKHHLIPRACHKTKWFEKRFTKIEMGQRGVMVCRECHHAIHDAVPKEKDLG